MKAEQLSVGDVQTDSICLLDSCAHLGMGVIPSWMWRSRCNVLGWSFGKNVSEKSREMPGKLPHWSMTAVWIIYMHTQLLSRCWCWKVHFYFLILHKNPSFIYWFHQLISIIKVTVLLLSNLSMNWIWIYIYCCSFHFFSCGVFSYSKYLCFPNEELCGILNL